MSRPARIPIDRRLAAAFTAASYVGQQTAQGHLDAIANESVHKLILATDIAGVCT
jgi:hypothetical protein